MQVGFKYSQTQQMPLGCARLTQPTEPYPGKSLMIKPCSRLVILLIFMMVMVSCQGDRAGEDFTFVSIAVTPSNTSISPGSTQQFLATGTDTNRNEHDLTHAVTWSSSDTGVATIDDSEGPKKGLATAIAPGSTTITATRGDVSGSTTLTVAN